MNTCLYTSHDSESQGLRDFTAAHKEERLEGL